MAVIIILLLNLIIPDNYIKGIVLDDKKNPINGVNIYDEKSF